MLCLEQAAMHWPFPDRLSGSNDLDGAGDLCIEFDVQGLTQHGEMGLEYNWQPIPIKDGEAQAVL